MRIPALLLAVSLVALAPSWTEAADPALDKLAADWSAAYEKGDAKALAGFYTEDAVRMTAEGGTVLGRAAIEKELAANLAGPWKGTKIAIKVGTTRPVSADVALNEGTFEISGVMGPDGKPMTLTGNYVNTIVKKGGAWVIASNAAAPTPAPRK